MQPPVRNSLLSWRSALFVAWLLTGIGCIVLDGQVQPWLTKIGYVSPIRGVARFWEELGSTFGIALFILSGVLLLRLDKGRTLLHFVVSISLAGASVQLLKHLIGRVRPNLTGDTTIFSGPFGLLNTEKFHRIDSMPSGHTAAAFAMALALAYRWPRQSWLWLAIACGVGVSRTLVDAHFPSDVILGALLGTLIGLLTNSWANRYVYGRPHPLDVPVEQTDSPSKWIGQ